MNSSLNCVKIRLKNPFHFKKQTFLEWKGSMDVKDSSWNHYVNKEWKASMDVKCSTWNHYVNKEWKGSMDVNGASWTHDVNKEPLLF